MVSTQNVVVESDTLGHLPAFLWLQKDTCIKRERVYTDYSLGPECGREAMNPVFLGAGGCRMIPLEVVRRIDVLLSEDVSQREIARRLHVGRNQVREIDQGTRAAYPVPEVENAIRPLENQGDVPSVVCWSSRRVSIAS